MSRFHRWPDLPAKLAELLSALDNVTPFGGNRWMASSPLRSDSTPSLSISLSEDGDRILLHDFGAASSNATEEILEYLGMKFDDLFIRSDKSVRRHTTPPTSYDSSRSMLPKAVLKYYLDSVKSGRRGKRHLFASTLGLPAKAIGTFEWGFDSYRKAFTIPERDHTGQIIGVQRRLIQGRKKAVKGSKRGLTGLETLRSDRSGRLHVCEGFSDVVALYSLGFMNVLGVPSAGVGGELIRSVILDGQYSDIVIVSDPKPQEREAAHKLGKSISDLIQYRVIMPPGGVDMRDWINQNKITAKDVDCLINNTPCAISRFRLWSLEDVERLPPREHLVEGILGVGEFGVLYGPPKSGKSLVALDMCMAVQAGLPWRSGQKRVRQGHVIYVAAEGKAGYKDRVKVCRRRYNRTRSRSKSGVGDIRFIFDQPVLSGGDAVALVNAIKNQRCNPDLVVIDTLARTNGGDENSAADMSAYIRGLDDLRRELNCAVLVLHHQPRHDNRMRGSVALDGACDVAIRTTRSGDVITLECEFAKDDPPFDAIYLRMKQVPVDKDHSSIRIIRAGPLEVVVAKDKRNTKANASVTRIMEALYQLSSKCKDRWVRRAAWLDAIGMNQHTFNNHLKTLRIRGEIIERRVGKYKEYQPVPINNQQMSTVVADGDVQLSTVTPPLGGDSGNS